MWRTLLLPVAAGFITWGSLQLKIYIEEKMAESREKKLQKDKRKLLTKAERKQKTYDHKWEDE